MGSKFILATVALKYNSAKILIKNVLPTKLHILFSMEKNTQKQQFRIWKLKFAVLQAII